MSDANAPAPGASPQGAVPTAGEPVVSETPATASAPAELSPPAAPPLEQKQQEERPAGRPSLEPPADDPARRRDKTIGTVIVVIAFIVSLGISLWAKHASRPEVSDPPRPASPEGVIGYPAAVDVVATLPAARRLTKRPLLRGIVAEGVSSKGTIDLNQPGTARIKYTFQSPPGHGPQPPREPGTLPRMHYCGKQTVQVRKAGVAADPDRPESPCMPKVGEPLPDPQCGLGELWQVAIKRGVPSDRLAKIEYFRAQAGPAWRFEVPGNSKFRFTMLGDCRRELTGVEAQNL